MSFRTLTPELAASLGLPPSSRGAAIADIPEGAPPPAPGCNRATSSLTFIAGGSDRPTRCHVA